MPIIINEKIMHGEPIIKGTRVPVKIILGSLAGGMTYDEVMKEYGISNQDILDSLEYAAKQIAEEEIHIVNS